MILRFQPVSGVLLPLSLCSQLGQGHRPLFHACSGGLAWPSGVTGVCCCLHQPVPFSRAAFSLSSSQTFFWTICPPHPPPGAPVPACPSSSAAAVSSQQCCHPHSLSLFHCPQPRGQGRLQDGGRSALLPCWSRVKLLVSSASFPGGWGGRQSSS